jgi:hypothetical protein
VRLHVLRIDAVEADDADVGELDAPRVGAARRLAPGDVLRLGQRIAPQRLALLLGRRAAERDRVGAVVADGLGVLDGTRLILTDRGRLLADGVVRTLLAD